MSLYEAVQYQLMGLTWHSGLWQAGHCPGSQENGAGNLVPPNSQLGEEGTCLGPYSPLMRCPVRAWKLKSLTPYLHQFTKWRKKGGIQLFYVKDPEDHVGKVQRKNDVSLVFQRSFPFYTSWACAYLFSSVLIKNVLVILVRTWLLPFVSLMAYYYSCYLKKGHFHLWERPPSLCGFCSWDFENFFCWTTPAFLIVPVSCIPTLKLERRQLFPHYYSAAKIRGLAIRAI